jgi:hypothetical protein
MRLATSPNPERTTVISPRRPCQSRSETHTQPARSGGFYLTCCAEADLIDQRLVGYSSLAAVSPKTGHHRSPPSLSEVLACGPVLGLKAWQAVDLQASGLAARQSGVATPALGLQQLPVTPSGPGGDCPASVTVVHRRGTDPS